jgi:hypothetical protein
MLRRAAGAEAKKLTVMAAKHRCGDVRFEPKLITAPSERRLDGRGVKEGDALPARRSINRNQGWRKAPSRKLS